MRNAALKSAAVAILLWLAHGIAWADSETIIGHLASDGAKLTSDESLLTALYWGAVEELGEGTVIDSLYLELNGAEWYLIATGTAATPGGMESRIVGAPLNADREGNLRFASGRTKHKCAGSPCARCRFTNDATGDINGCACGKGGTLCNHSIETTGAAGWFGSNIH